MARTVTLLELQNAIKFRYNLPAYSATSFVSTTDVTAAINSSLQSYYAILAGMFGDAYFAASQTLTTSASIGLTSLPTRFYKLTKLWWVRGTDDIQQILPANLDQLELANYAAKSWNDYTPRYRLSGSSALQWVPIPSAAYTVVCDYIALPEDLVAAGDTVDAGAGFDGWIVADVCSKIAQREDKDMTPWLVERAACEARIAEFAGSRDEGESFQLRDVTSSGESDYARRNRLTQIY